MPIDTVLIVDHAAARCRWHVASLDYSISKLKSSSNFKFPDSTGFEFVQLARYCCVRVILCYSKTYLRSTQIALRMPYSFRFRPHSQPSPAIHVMNATITEAESQANLTSEPGADS
eukprot:6180308-Pleurochrysis_carterae.AAC.1